MKLFKKTAALLLCAVIALAAVPGFAAGSTDIPEGLEYDVDEYGAIITSYTGSSASLVIPDRIGGVPVLRIASEAFYGNSRLTSVVLPSGMDCIEMSAFEDCTALKSVYIDAGEIGERAFAGCTALESVLLSNNVEGIYSEAFAGCTKLQNVHLGAYLMEIYECAFQDCTSLKSIVIPNNVYSIDYNAFAGCTALSEVVFGRNLEYIDSEAFLDCASLKSVTLPPLLSDIAWDAFVIGYDSMDNEIYPSFSGYAGTYAEMYAKAELGAKFTAIGTNSGTNYTGDDYDYDIIEDFFYDEDDNEYTMSYAVINEYFGESASVTVPAKIEDCPVRVISEYAFEGHEEITSLTIPDNVAVIGYGAFADCYNLRTLKLGNSLMFIDDEAFSSCESLTSITMPTSGNLRSIGASAFAFCGFYENGSGYVEGINSITIPASVSYIHEDAFEGALINAFNVNSSNKYYKLVNGAVYTKDGLELVVYPSGESQKNVNVPEGTFKIGNSAFTSAYLGELTLPASLIVIGDRSFEDSWFKKMTVKSGNPKYAVRNELLMTADGTKVIKAPNLSTVTKFVIPDGTEEINNCAFEFCENITDIEIPYGVTRLGDRAFMNCEKLKSITIPGSVKTIGDDAGSYCEALETVVVGEGVETIGSGAFRNCTKLAEVTLPKSLKLIDSYAFGYSNAIKTVNYGGSEADWALINIAYGNECLTGAKVNYAEENPGGEPVINNVDLQFNVNELTVAAVTANIPATAWLAAAGYNDSGELVEVITLADGKGTFDTGVEYIDKVTVFAWDSAESMKPLCEEYSKTL